MLDRCMTDGTIAVLDYGGRLLAYRGIVYVPAVLLVYLFNYRVMRDVLNAIRTECLYYMYAK